jgi:UDP-galactopyranose mutase
VPFINRVKVVANGRAFSLPINLITKHFPQSGGAPLSRIQLPIPKLSSKQALRFVGPRLEAFFKGYTFKQCKWSASILKRLPVRFDYQDN